MRLSSAKAAEQAYYDAFRSVDLDAMLALWSRETAICLHPGGALLNNFEAVAQSWRELFQGGGALEFLIDSIHWEIDTNYATHTLIETVSVPGSPVSRGQVAATNAYRQRADGGWEMVMHHASVLPQLRTRMTPERDAPAPDRSLH